MAVSATRALLAALALALAACGVDVRYDAAQDVRAFLEAARAGDREAFEAHIDRPAVRADVRAQLRERLAEQDPVVRFALEQALARGLIDGMISPEAFQLAQASGQGVQRIPTTAELAVMLRPQGEDRVCLTDPRAQAQDCQLVFEKQDGTWRLVALNARGLRIAPRPAAG